MDPHVPYIPDDPYPKITEEERDRAYNYLKNFKFTDSLTLSRKTNNSSNFFFLEERLKARKNSKWSIKTAWEDEDERNRVLKIVNKYHPNGYKKSDIYRTLKMYYGNVGQFRPDVAKWIYQKYSVKNVLDPCSGWGDRLVAAISSDINYTGIDSNYELKKCYESMINYYCSSDNKIEMYYGRSEIILNQIENKKYDIVFTSPPYYTLEKYQNMYNYGSYKNFVDLFLIPTVKQCLLKLNDKGVLALNIPDRLYKSLNNLLGPSSEKIEIPLKNRNTSKNKEVIHIWLKTNR